MNNLLNIIDKGVFYTKNRMLGPAHRSLFEGFPSSDNGLCYKVNITFDEIDQLISCGYVFETFWGNYVAACLTYDGKRKLLVDNGWRFENWHHRRYACCKKAIPTFCVCTIRTQCPDHGDICNGTHE